jgi:hypothetical protein
MSNKLWQLDGLSRCLAGAVRVERERVEQFLVARRVAGYASRPSPEPAQDGASGGRVG